MITHTKTPLLANPLYDNCFDLLSETWNEFMLIHSHFFPNIPLGFEISILQNKAHYFWYPHTFMAPSFWILWLKTNSSGMSMFPLIWDTVVFEEHPIVMISVITEKCSFFFFPPCPYQVRVTFMTSWLYLYDLLPEPVVVTYLKLWWFHV